MKALLHDINAQSVDSRERLCELEVLAGEVFGSQEGAACWLRKSHPLLDELSPVEVAKSHDGFQRVKDLLLNIKFGGAV